MKNGFLLLFCAWVLASCGEAPPPTPAAARAAGLAEQTGDIVVGVSWMWSKELDLMRQGIELAAEEVNRQGIDGRQIRLVWADDGEEVERGLTVATNFIDDPDIAAVIGHSTSSITLKTAPLYSEAGILLLAPGATHPSLTGLGHPLVFRTIPSDTDAGRQLADFASQQAFLRVGLCHIDNAYGNALSDIFKKRKIGSLKVVETLTYAPGESIDFNETLDTWKDLNLDAVVLVATMPQAAHFVHQARLAGLEIPIIGADGLDSPELTQIAGPAAEGVVVFSIFHPGAPRPAVRAFSKSFTARYGRPPDVWAALGYDTVKVLTEAIDRADSAVPQRVAEALRNLKDWSGATGPFSFGSNGELKYKPIVSKIMRQGRFEPLKMGMLR